MSHYKRTAKSSKKNNDKKTKVKYSVKIAESFRDQVVPQVKAL